MALPNLDTVSLERDGHILLIGLNRPHKRNSFDRAMLADLSRAYAVLESSAAGRPVRLEEVMSGAANVYQAEIDEHYGI